MHIIYMCVCVYITTVFFPIIPKAKQNEQKHYMIQSFSVKRFSPASNLHSCCSFYQENTPVLSRALIFFKSKLTIFFLLELFILPPVWTALTLLCAL